ncbi:MAG: YciI family protein [Pirellulales bacterium]
MRYLLLMYGDEKCWTEEERTACMLESLAICDELAAQGKFIAAAPLHSVTTATSLRVRDGKRLVTDGPFAETTEQLGGYYVLEVADLDEAIAIASRLPPARKGTVEIRPIFDVSVLAR